MSGWTVYPFQNLLLSYEILGSDIGGYGVWCHVVW